MLARRHVRNDRRRRCSVGGDCEGGFSKQEMLVSVQTVNPVHDAGELRAVSGTERRDAELFAAVGARHHLHRSLR